MRKFSIPVFLACAILLLVACGGNDSAETNKNQDVLTNNTVENQNDIAQESSETVAEEQVTPEEQESGFKPLPAIQQKIDIITEDGRTLEGFYYPAKIPDAPVVVLLHWAPGTMDDWQEIALWLQNRQEEIGMDSTAPIIMIGSKTAQAADWTDQTWFPPMPEEISFAVLTFNFGGYGNSTGGRETWLLDAQAAIYHAASLPGVDPHQISTLGASIGSDGSVDGCYLLNDRGEMGTCVGAFSLSPGNYLTDDFSYAEAVEMLDKEDHPVWCLAAEDDYESPVVCLSAEGDRYRSFIYPGNLHGMRLIERELYPGDPPLDYNVLQLIQEWLEEVYLITLNQINLD